MMISVCKHETLYNDVLHTIQHLMQANDVKRINMRDTVFGKRGGWKELVMDDDGVIAYNCQSEMNGQPLHIRFNFDMKDWHFAIHRFDLPELLKIVLNKLCDEICVKEI